MTDTYTSSNRLTEQEIGGHSSTWGNILNTVIGLIDDSLDGVITVDVSAANVTLSTNNGAADEARVRVLQVIGNPAGTQRTITVPDQDKWYLVHNMTSVSTSVTFKNTSGTGTVINPGVKAIVYCDTASTRTFLESATSVAILPIASGGTSASTAASARTEFGLGNLATVSVNVANSLIGTDNSGNPVSVSVRNPIRVSSAVLQIDAASSASSGVIRIATSNEVSVGTSRTTALSPGLASKLFHPSAVSNGYIDMPGGITFQWGKYSGGAHGPTISFNKSFTTTLWNIQCKTTGTSAAVVFVTNMSAGGFTGLQYTVGNVTGNADFYWLAIGPT